MALTAAQKVTLKANIQATPEANQFYVDGNLQGLADYYNVVASPAFWVWRTAVTKREVVDQISRTGTSFIWAGNGFISRSVGELECFNQLFNSTLICNPSLANVRQAFVDIFSGTGNAASNRGHLDTVARRLATRLETLFATGTGTDTAAGSGTMVVEGPLLYPELIGL